MGKKYFQEFVFFFQDILVMAEENLDIALAKVCTNFDTHSYSRIQVHNYLILEASRGTGGEFISTTQFLFLDLKRIFFK